MDDRQYNEICKPRFDKIEEDAKETKRVTYDIHRVVSNGLQEKTKENNERIKALDNRMWMLMSSVVLSIALQILFKVIL